MGIFSRKKKHRREKGAMGLGLADSYAGPRKTEDQTSPEPERLTRPDEEAGVAVHQMKNPPKAEG